MSERKLLPQHEDADFDYNDARHRRWRTSCLRRDGFVCQNCGRTANMVHHKKSVDAYPEERYNVDNGVSLCNACHAIAHGVRKKATYDPETGRRNTYGESKGVWRNRWTHEIVKRGHKI